jgi:hypothetical protein
MKLGGAGVRHGQFWLWPAWIALLAPAVQAGESVLYSITTSEAHSVVPVTKNQVFKTEIFAVDSETGKQRLIFSAAGYVEKLSRLVGRSSRKASSRSGVQPGRRSSTSFSIPRPRASSFHDID